MKQTPRRRERYNLKKKVFFKINIKGKERVKQDCINFI